MATPNIQPIKIDDMDSLGVDQDGRLYWKNVPVKTEERIKLSFWQSLLACVTIAATMIAAAAAVVQAVCAVIALRR